MIPFALRIPVMRKVSVEAFGADAAGACAASRAAESESRAHKSSVIAAISLIVRQVENISFSFHSRMKVDPSETISASLIEELVRASRAHKSSVIAAISLIVRQVENISFSFHSRMKVDPSETISASLIEELVGQVARGDAGVFENAV